MSTNTKSPAMLLQEFTVKKRIPPPEYNLIVCNIGTHENEFQFKVNVGNVTAIGIGRSKQVAKHDAAFKAIELLTSTGDYDLTNSPLVDFNPQLHRNEPDQPHQPAVNCIGTLSDACCENKIPHPEFIEISDIGPPHCRQFTYECRISSIRTQATANTKRQAKQLAAKHMLDRIRRILPELVTESEEHRNAITEMEGNIHCRYSRLSFFSVIIDKSAHVIHFPYCFVTIMEVKNLTIENFIEPLKLRTEEALEQILEMLDLKHQFILFQENPPAVLLNLNTDTPFCVLGIGTSVDQAKNNALNETFTIMETYIRNKKYYN